MSYGLDLESELSHLERSLASGENYCKRQISKFREILESNKNLVNYYKDIISENLVNLSQKNELTPFFELFIVEAKCANNFTKVVSVTLNEVSKIRNISQEVRVSLVKRVKSAKNLLKEKENEYVSNYKILKKYEKLLCTSLSIFVNSSVTTVCLNSCSAPNTGESREKKKESGGLAYKLKQSFSSRNLTETYYSTKENTSNKSYTPKDDDNSLKEYVEKESTPSLRELDLRNYVSSTKEEEENVFNLDLRKVSNTFINSCRESLSSSCTNLREGLLNTYRTNFSNLYPVSPPNYSKNSFESNTFNSNNASFEINETIQEELLKERRRKEGQVWKLLEGIRRDEVLCNYFFSGNYVFVGNNSYSLRNNYLDLEDLRRRAERLSYIFLSDFKNYSNFVYYLNMLEKTYRSRREFKAQEEEFEKEMREILLSFQEDKRMHRVWVGLFCFYLKHLKFFFDFYNRCSTLGSKDGPYERKERREEELQLLRERERELLLIYPRLGKLYKHLLSLSPSNVSNSVTFLSIGSNVGASSRNVDSNESSTEVFNNCYRDKEEDLLFLEGFLTGYFAILENRLKYHSSLSVSLSSYFASNSTSKDGSSSSLGIGSKISILSIGSNRGIMSIGSNKRGSSSSSSSSRGDLSSCSTRNRDSSSTNVRESDSSLEGVKNRESDDIVTISSRKDSTSTNENSGGKYKIKKQEYLDQSMELVLTLFDKTLRVTSSLQNPFFSFNSSRIKRRTSTSFANKEAFAGQDKSREEKQEERDILKMNKNLLINLMFLGLGSLEDDLGALGRFLQNSVKMNLESFLPYKLRLRDEVKYKMRCSLHDKIILNGVLFVTTEQIGFFSSFNKSTLFGKSTCITFNKEEIGKVVYRGSKLHVFLVDSSGGNTSSSRSGSSLWANTTSSGRAGSSFVGSVASSGGNSLSRGSSLSGNSSFVGGLSTASSFESATLVGSLKDGTVVKNVSSGSIKEGVFSFKEGVVSVKESGTVPRESSESERREETSVRESVLGKMREDIFRRRKEDEEEKGNFVFGLVSPGEGPLNFILTNFNPSVGFSTDVSSADVSTVSINREEVKRDIPSPTSRGSKKEDYWELFGEDERRVVEEEFEFGENCSAEHLLSENEYGLSMEELFELVFKSNTDNSALISKSRVMLGSTNFEPASQVIPLYFSGSSFVGCPDNLSGSSSPCISGRNCDITRNKEDRTSEGFWNKEEKIREGTRTKDEKLRDSNKTKTRENTEKERTREKSKDVEKNRESGKTKESWKNKKKREEEEEDEEEIVGSNSILLKKTLKYTNSLEKSKILKNLHISTEEKIKYFFGDFGLIYQSTTSVLNVPYSKHFTTVYTIVVVNNPSYSSTSSMRESTSNISNRESSSSLLSGVSRESGPNNPSGPERVFGSVRESVVSNGVVRLSSMSGINGVDGEVNRQTGEDEEEEEYEEERNVKMKIYGRIKFKKKIMFEKVIRNEALEKVCQASDFIVKNMEKHQLLRVKKKVKVQKESNEIGRNKLFLIVLLLILVLYKVFY